MLLDELDQLNIKATFVQIGKQLDSPFWSKYLLKADKAGHTIVGGTFSFSSNCK